MVKAGDGYRFHTTGLTHDERGYPVINAEAQDWNVRHIIDKITKNADKIIKFEEDQTDNADVVVVSYGITSRVAVKAVQEARKAGIKVGTLRLITSGPSPRSGSASSPRRSRPSSFRRSTTARWSSRSSAASAGQAPGHPVSHAAAGSTTPKISSRPSRRR